MQDKKKRTSEKIVGNYQKKLVDWFGRCDSWFAMHAPAANRPVTSDTENPVETMGSGPCGTSRFVATTQPTAVMQGRVGVKDASYWSGSSAGAVRHVHLATKSQTLRLVDKLELAVERFSFQEARLEVASMHFEAGRISAFEMARVESDVENAVDEIWEQSSIISDQLAQVLENDNSNTSCCLVT